VQSFLGDHALENKGIDANKAYLSLKTPNGDNGSIV
jgi:hypothetical protein